MDEDKLFQLENQIGESLTAFRDTIKTICEPLSDEEINELAQHYYTEANPTSTHNFPMPIYKEVAEMVEGELAFRRVFRHATEYMNRTGETYYCVVCGGACKGHE